MLTIVYVGGLTKKKCQTYQYGKPNMLKHGGLTIRKQLVTINVWFLVAISYNYRYT